MRRAAAGSRYVALDAGLRVGITWLESHACMRPMLSACEWILGNRMVAHECGARSADYQAADNWILGPVAAHSAGAPIKTKSEQRASSTAAVDAALHAQYAR